MRSTRLVPLPLVALSLGCTATVPPAGAEPVEVRATPVPLDAADPAHARLDRLTYRGGLRLESPAPAFGGLSGLHVSADGASLVAVSDRGRWLRARLAYDAAGNLAGFTRAEMGPLLDTRGQPLDGKINQDAESLAQLADGSWAVGFERRHRLWRYPAGPRPLQGRAAPLPVPGEALAAPANGGLEALATLPDGRLVAICEELLDGRRVRGFVREGRRWGAFTYPSEGGLRPAGAATLPSGDLVVLERLYAPGAGVTVRLRRVPARDVHAGAAVEGDVLAHIPPPLNVDNFEGVAARRAPGGETLVYLLSDDNFSADQRTLLMMFALDEAGLPP